MALLRQIIETDGLLLRELLRVIVTAQECIRRDTIALQLGLMAERALQSAQSLRLPPPLLVEGKKFVALVRRTTAKRPSGSRAPGVLEHRMSPRLEWLADFGALTKYGLPKNSFEYSRTPDAALLFDLLDTNAESANWADDAALKYWRTSTRWNDSRAGLERLETRSALQRGYSIMRRTVGPTSIREVCFAAGVLTPHINHRMEDLVSSLLDWASGEPRLTVSGGRYTRSPELIHMSAELLGEV